MQSGPAQRAAAGDVSIVKLAVSPREDFRNIIRRLDDVSIPHTRVSASNLRFAILELLNNSIRAQREKGDDREIQTVFTIADGRLEVSVRDFGGGFDPRALPYDLFSDPATVDLHSAPFEAYQRKNRYKRFGMGLYIARKTFDSIQIQFVDNSGRPTSWDQGRVAGTVINLSAKVDKTDARREAANER